MRVFPVPDKKGKVINKRIIADMFSTMEDLMREGIRPSDMMILVRWNKEAMDVARYFQENILTDKVGYPKLNTTRLVSRDSFVLKQSKSVLAIINALRYIENQDAVAGHFVKLATEQADVCAKLDSIDKSLPLYEMVQAPGGTAALQPNNGRHCVYQLPAGQCAGIYIGKRLEPTSIFAILG